MTRMICERISLLDTSFDEEKITAPASDTASASVLLIEDDEMVAIVARMILEKLRYRVLVAETGSQALQMVRTTPQPIDVVLLDMILPDMDGDEVFSRLMATCPRLKIIVCSGYADSDAAQKMMDSGACGFLHKPYTKQSLSAMLEQIMQNG